MKNIFSFEGPVFSLFEKLANLLWLNILWMICCVPIITIGASTTAMYYIALKMVKDEESYITKSFFKSFIQNFKQATIVWIAILFTGVIVFVDTQIMGQDGNILSKGINIVIYAGGFLLLMLGVYIFPLIAKFENSVKNYFKNALILSMVNAPFTLLIVIIMIIPVALAYYMPALIPVSLFFGGSVVAYSTSFIFNKIFSKLIGKEEIADEKEEQENDETKDNNRVEEVE